MLQQIIKIKKDKWLTDPSCQIISLINYIKNIGFLRYPQIEAIETYLFLKILGKNKPIWKLFADGFFILQEEDLAKLNISSYTRDFLASNISARSLYYFSKMKVNGKSILPDLEKLIIEQPDNLDYERIIKSIFYNIDYSDYLFSLPMGAGKTFLMAAFIYLDLYFAKNEPENPNFAHNFIVLVPSGLKSSITPSLKTIEHFNPEWILPEPSASELKRELKFEVLDQPKASKKSNKAISPNAQKVNRYLNDQNLSGLVLVVNAEKVILDRLELTEQGACIERTQTEKDLFANELRHFIGKIPNLQILIDEVHHAATDEVKLRQVVNQWNAGGNITTSLGFSGTPYLSSPDKVNLTDDSFLKFSQITNTVYYYPLIEGVKTFLKKPTVKTAVNLEPLQIIEQGVKEFYALYKDKKYQNGTIPKLAIYCGKIERLETEVYPFLVELIKQYGDTAANILKYHKGNSQFKLPKENELDFNSLGLEISQKRIVLLVQVGKEGWDCRSLAGVILAQKGDSPSNMVLQTSCRCLRQVDKETDETALIYLNDSNSKILNKQLQDEQQTSIDEINSINKNKAGEFIKRFSRMEYLDLPLVEFCQLEIKYKTLIEQEELDLKNDLLKLEGDLDKYKLNSFISAQENFETAKETSFIDYLGDEKARFDFWICSIIKESFNFINYKDLEPYFEILIRIFDNIVYSKNEILYFNKFYNNNEIKSQIRSAFAVKRSLATSSEIVPKKAQLLLAENLRPFEKNDKFFPNESDVAKILDYDARNINPESDASSQEIRNAYNAMKDLMEKSGMGAMVIDYESFKKSRFDHSLGVISKNKTFHYLPYNFAGSAFELLILKEILQLEEIKRRGLEVYYNGECGLTGFVIDCFVKSKNHWKKIGKYTPDFLIIKRVDNIIHKALILETKGAGFAGQEEFINRKNYVETEFLKANNEKFGYKRFEFLYVQDDEKLENNLAKINNKFKEFFND